MCSVGQMDSTRRGCVVWLGGVRAGWNEDQVIARLAPFEAEVRHVTLRRKGWRDPQTCERIGFALVELSSERAAEEAVEHFAAEDLDVRPHRWQPRTIGDDNDPCADPLASLLAGASACCSASDAHDGMPPLEEQLEPLTIGQARARLQGFGVGSTAAGEARAQRRGGRVEKKAYLIGLICRLHRAQPVQFPRAVRRARGAPLQAAVLDPLLAELRSTVWPQKRGRNVDAQHYLVLGVPAAGVAPKLLPRYSALWQRACEALWSLVPSFEPTSIAIAHNFRGSPHVDVADRTPQYLLSCGDFAAGGELCVEASPTELICVDTHDRLACVDGRFTHWVTSYDGAERFSVVFYRLDGPVELAVSAFHEVRGHAEDGMEGAGSRC